MVDIVSKLFAHKVIDKSIIFVFLDPLELLHFLGRVMLLLLLLNELFLEGWVGHNREHGCARSRYKVETDVVLEFVRVVVADLLADGLACDFVDVLVVASVDGAVHKQ